VPRRLPVPASEKSETARNILNETVDVARPKVAGSLYRKLGLSAANADARAVLFCTFLFGQSMLFLGETPRRRANLIATSARFLLEIEQQ